MCVRGDKMKKFKIVLLFLILSLLLCGCSNFRFAGSIDDLISPISPSGDNAGVQNAVDEYCKSGYLIKIPSSGDYRTSFIFYDLDGDGQDEAIAFYEPSDSLATVNMAVLNKVNDKWNVVENIVGDGTDINSVDFCDVNNDGVTEIIVCWSVITKSTNLNLEIYRQNKTDDTYKLEKMDDSITAAEFICADVNGDHSTDLLVFTIGSGSESPVAQLYSFESNKKVLLGQTKLDSSIISFSNITIGESDEGVSIYADAVRSNGDSMVTEFIYWSDYYDSIVSPFYSYSTGKTSETTRKSIINSKDIDSDGIVEIPIDKSVSKLPEQITAQNWMEYSNTVLKHKCYSLSCKRDGYSLVVGDNDFSDINVKYDNENRMMTVLSGNQECFNIITIIKSAYNSSDEKYKNYTEIYSNSGFVYLAEINDKSSIKVTTQDLKNMIKSY